MKNLIGQDLGRYHIIEPLGQGGMASVFKGYDTTLERYVAVKVIRTDVDGGDESEFLKRFQREAKALAQLDHPYILKVLDYGEQEGIPYLVMPFVPGGTLKQKMGTPLTYQEAASLLAPIARALEYAHNQKIIHRDVKPANILVSQSGAPLLSDFGIAKVLASGGSTQLTATGVGIGTPDYMAPEQWTGEADPRTDVYSLGVVFYEMVTGRRPFTADTPAAVLIKHLRDPLPRPKSFVHDLPDNVEQVLFKALDKDPVHRYQDMGAFAAALEKLSRSETVAIPAATAEFETIKSTGAAATVLQGPTLAVSHTPAPASMPAPAVQPEKKPASKAGLIALAVVAVLAVLCVIVGGAGWAAFSKFRASMAPSDVPAAVTETSGQTGQDATTPPQQEKTTEATGEQPTEPAPEAGTTPVESIKGYPEDVPMLTDNNGDLENFTQTTGDGQTTNMFAFSTNMVFVDVVAFFKDGMKENGWNLYTEQTQDNQTLLYFMKGEARMVMINVSDESDVRQVAVMVIQQ